MREAEMRSLERPGLYRAFAPLDPHEPLPRELLLENREGPTWGFRLGRQHLAGLAWPFALLATLGLVTRATGSAALALAAAGLLLGAFWAFAFRRR